MSKHETSNQFNNGLMMDVHPLQTPNTVLTDCLNGTFITYNGNEHVLQNDMGNYKLEKCKLKENYIPIGTASYGDILYIASYNPIDKKFELGSYPSPLQWNALSNDDTRSLYSVIDNFVNDSSSEDKRLSWLDMTKFTQTEIFDDPGFKLQPGDEYLLNISGNSEYKMEKLNYYIMDDNRVKHKVQVDANEKKPVSWETPGYLCVEHSVMTPFEHNLSLKKVVVGNNSVTYSLRSILTIQDEELCLLTDTDEIHKQFIFEITVSLKEGNKIIKFYHSLNDRQKANSEQTEFKFDSVEVFPWLNDRRQIIFDYTATIPYDGNNALVNKQDDNTLVYNTVPTTITVLPTFLDDNGVTILYDNLQQSLSYSASGDNISSAATKYFTWNRVKNENDSDNYVWEISWDVFKANEKDEITYDLKDFDGNSIIVYDKNNNRIDNKTIYSDPTIRIENKYDDQLICLILTIKKESGETVKTGRFAFLDTSGIIKYSIYTRMDVTCNVQDVFVNICNNIEPTVSLENIITDKKLIFNCDEFNVIPNKHTVWFDNQIDKTDLKYSQTWTCEPNVQINVKNFEGIWKDLQIVKQLSNDKKTTFGAKWMCVKSQPFDAKQEKYAAYIPITSVNIIDWGKHKELAWDQTDTYDVTMRIHEGDTKGKYSEYFNNSDWEKGTNHKLWTDWLVKKENWLFTSIYAYKYKNGGNYYYISNIGSARDKGRAGIDGSHIVGCEYGSTIPEIIMTTTLDGPIRNNLAYVTIDNSNKLKYWKNRYLYSINTTGHSIKESQNKTFIRYKGEYQNNGTLAWLFNSDKNKLYEKYPDVEFDSLSKMEWLTSQWTEFVELTIKQKTETLEMEEPKWTTIVDEIREDFNKYNSIYDNMTSKCTNYSIIPVDCLHWFSEDFGKLSDDEFPLCCIYNKDSKKISFNASLANKLGKNYQQVQSYFQVNYSGTIKTNLGPLKIIKYGF